MEKTERTLRIGNLSSEVSPAELRELFSQFGKVSSVNILSELRAISQAFVSMSAGGAQAALDSMEGRRWRGRRMTVRKYYPSYQGIEEDDHELHEFDGDDEEDDDLEPPPGE
jgi:RNA recognition motif-containing protein